MASFAASPLTPKMPKLVKASCGKLLLRAAFLLTLRVHRFGSCASDLHVAFDTREYAWFVLLLGLSSYFSFLTSFAQSLLSAKSLVKNIFWANAMGLTSGVIVFALLTEQMKQPGVLMGLVAIVVCPAVFFMIQLIGRSWFSFEALRPIWNPEVKRTLLPYTMIATIGSALAPIIFVALRSGIEDKMGWDYVGYWQAISKSRILFFRSSGC